MGILTVNFYKGVLLILFW